MVAWDAIPDVEGFEMKSESPCELAVDKWRMNSRYSWRMDLDVELFDNYYSRDEIENDVVEPLDGDVNDNDGESLSSSSDEWCDEEKGGNEGKGEYTYGEEAV